MNIKDFTKAENQIDKRIKELYPEGNNIDGAANAEKYLNAKVKVLFVLKESNDYCGSMRDLHANNDDNVINGYKFWKSTYKKLLYVVHGVLKQSFIWNDMKDLQNDGSINGHFHLDEIALINLKKQTGVSKSNQSEILKHYLNTKEIIGEQIKYLKPDIIINATRIDHFFDDMVGDAKIYKQNFCEYSLSKDKLIINTYHPNARINEEFYVDTILDIVKNNFTYR